jgi:hypothetical protein
MISKADASYVEQGTKAEHCSICEHFVASRDPRCSEVTGRIHPGGWCRLFLRKGRAIRPGSKPVAPVPAVITRYAKVGS